LPSHDLPRIAAMLVTTLLPFPVGPASACVAATDAVALGAPPGAPASAAAAAAAADLAVALLSPRVLPGSWPAFSLPPRLPSTRVAVQM